MKLADALKSHLGALETTSPEFASLLLVAFRSYAMALVIFKGRNALRRDLSGELEATAITLYNRRNYTLADEYIQHTFLTKNSSELEDATLPRANSNPTRGMG